MKFVSDCLTGKDNLTYDAGRVIGVLGALMYVVFWMVQVVTTCGIVLGHVGTSTTFRVTGTCQCPLTAH
jgi:hypothetical protein